MDNNTNTNFTHPDFEEPDFVTEVNDNLEDLRHEQSKVFEAIEAFNYMIDHVRSVLPDHVDVDLPNEIATDEAEMDIEDLDPDDYVETLDVTDHLAAAMTVFSDIEEDDPQVADVIRNLVHLVDTFRHFIPGHATMTAKVRANR